MPRVVAPQDPVASAHVPRRRRARVGERGTRRHRLVLTAPRRSPQPRRARAADHLAPEPDADPDALESLFAAVALQRSNVTFRLASARALPRYETVLGHIDRLVAVQPPLTARADEESRAALGSLLRRPWRNVREAARRSRESPNEANLHALRIPAKELRYAAELASGVFGQRLPVAPRDDGGGGTGPARRPP